MVISAITYQENQLNIGDVLYSDYQKNIFYNQLTHWI